MPFEIAKKLKIKIEKTITDVQEGAMQDTWIEFCKANDLDQLTMIGDHDIAEKWMYFASSKYQEPLPPVSNNWQDQ